MIPRRQAVTGKTAKGSYQTKPVHCTKCGDMIRVTRILGKSRDVQSVCGKCKRK